MCLASGILGFGRKDVHFQIEAQQGRPIRSIHLTFIDREHARRVGGVHVGLVLLLIVNITAETDVSHLIDHLVQSFVSVVCCQRYHRIAICGEDLSKQEDPSSKSFLMTSSSCFALSASIASLPMTCKVEGGVGLVRDDGSTVCFWLAKVVGAKETATFNAGNLCAPPGG